MESDQKPLVKNHKVLIKYQLEQEHEYWVLQKNIRPLGDKPHRTNNSATSRHAQKIEKTILVDCAGAVCIYTDGASSGNPGPAGIGIFFKYGDKEKKISKYIGVATNNIAELEAIRHGLNHVKNPRLPVRVFTDSSYAMGLLTKGWRAKKNQTLVEAIRELMRKFKDLKFIKVKGHAGHPGNEMADFLATSAIKSAKP